MPHNIDGCNYGSITHKIFDHSNPIITIFGIDLNDKTQYLNL